jgi:hypothetical protein
MLSELLAALLNRLPRKQIDLFVTDLLLPAAASEDWLKVSSGRRDLQWRTEVHMKGGRADLVLSTGKLPLIVVENKVFSPIRQHRRLTKSPRDEAETEPDLEQDDAAAIEIEAVKNQLHTYGEWLRDALAASPARDGWPGALVLLTHACPPPEDFGRPNLDSYGVPWQRTCRWHEVWRWLDEHAGPDWDLNGVERQSGDTRPGWQFLARETADFLKARNMSSEYMTRHDLAFLDGYLQSYSRIASTFDLLMQRVSEEAPVKMKKVAWDIGEEPGAVWAYGHRRELKTVSDAMACDSSARCSLHRSPRSTSPLVGRT